MISVVPAGGVSLRMAYSSEIIWNTAASFRYDSLFRRHESVTPRNGGLGPPNRWVHLCSTQLRSYPIERCRLGRGLDRHAQVEECLGGRRTHACMLSDNSHQSSEAISPLP